MKRALVTLLGVAFILSGSWVLYASSAADWLAYNGDYASTRFSTLSELTPKNVSRLHQICTYALPERSELQSGIVAVDGILYFTTAQYTYAVGSANCRLVWRSEHKVTGTSAVRGVAVIDDRVVRGFRDGSVIAYRKADGSELWSAKLTEADGAPATIAAAPIAWNGLIFIGTSGAERACACIVAALDAATGQVRWTFSLVPTGAAPGADSWPKGVRVGGGSTWTSFTLDDRTGTLFVPTGNPGPDFSGAYRPGANLYTGSIVVLDAKSGGLRTWYQLVPHDVHDWDQAAAPALITTRQGKRRLLAAGKDGHLHAIDLAQRKVAWKTPVTTIANADAPITVEGTHFCPGTAGGVQWNGPGFSPSTNLAYVNSVDWCTTLKLASELPKFDPLRTFLGSANAFGDKDDRKVGWVTAVDADTGAVRWRYETTAPAVAGIVVTRTGLVITGDLSGDLLAFDATSGTLLHRIATGQPAGGGIITYLDRGRQRVAAALGLEGRILQTHGQPEVVIFGL
jgi:alcohol dehydrogenase (cytochrome c)